jgi:hypothetical protein
VRAEVAVKAALLALLCSCGSGDGFPDAFAPPPPPPKPGTFSVRWTLMSTSAAMVQTCAQANATKVTVGITDEKTSDHSSISFDCGLGDALSGDLAVGTYDLTYTLLGTAGTIATGTPQMGIAITSNGTTPVTDVVFTVP